MKKINKTVISGLDSGGYGGSEVFLQSLSEEFKKKNIKTEFLTVKTIDFYKYLKEKKENVIGFNFRMDLVGDWKGFIKFFLYFPYAIVCYIKVINNFNAETVVFLTGITDKIILTPLLAYKHIPVFWIEYAPINPLLNKFLGLPKVLYKFANRYVRKVLIPTNYAKKLLIENGVLNEDDVLVIPLGVKIVNIDANNINKSRRKVRKELKLTDKFVVGIISRLEKEKGQDTVVEVASLTNKYENIKYLISGVGENHDFLDYLIAKKKLQDTVNLLGFYPDHNKLELYSAFDLFIFPTRWKYEGWGLVLLEAMMMGVPVIASDFGPVPEVVGDAGFLVKNKPENYAKKIIELYKNPEILQKLSEKGKNRVKGFSIKKCAESYLTCVQNEINRI